MKMPCKGRRPRWEYCILPTNNGNELSMKLINFKLTDYKFTDEVSFINFLSSSEFVKSIENKINYKFSNYSLLAKSFAHRSFVNENISWWPYGSNESLEYLGDSIWNMVISLELFSRFPKEGEGVLSKLRGALVNEKKLSDLALLLGLESCVLLGKGEIKRHNILNESMLSDIFEAFVGALYLDSNKLDTVLALLNSLEASYYENYSFKLISLDLLSDFDPKSRLQEITLGRFGSVPTYVSEQLVNGTFLTKVLIEGKVYQMLEGVSKKDNERQLAKMVLNMSEFK